MAGCSGLRADESSPGRSAGAEPGHLAMRQDRLERDPDLVPGNRVGRRECTPRRAELRAQARVVQRPLRREPRPPRGPHRSPGGEQGRPMPVSPSAAGAARNWSWAARGSMVRARLLLDRLRESSEADAVAGRHICPDRLVFPRGRWPRCRIDEERAEVPERGRLFVRRHRVALSDVADSARGPGHADESVTTLERDLEGRAHRGLGQSRGRSRRALSKGPRT